MELLRWFKVSFKWDFSRVYSYQVDRRRGTHGFHNSLAPVKKKKMDSGKEKKKKKKKKKQIANTK